MVTSGRTGAGLDLERTDNMQRAYRLNQREQIVLDLQVHHLDTQASSSLCGINKEIRMLKGALQQTKRSTGSSAELLESSVRERQEAVPETRRIMYGTWVGERSLRNRSTLQSELLRNAARMRRRYERGVVEEEEEQQREEEEKEDAAEEKFVGAEESETRKPRTRSLPTKTEAESSQPPSSDFEIRPSSEPITFRGKRDQIREMRSILSRPKSVMHKNVSDTSERQDFEDIRCLKLQTEERRSLREKDQTDLGSIGRLSSSKNDLSAMASPQERKSLVQANQKTIPHSFRSMNEKLSTLTSRDRRTNNRPPCQTQAPTVLPNSPCNGHYYEPLRPFSADVAHLRHKFEKSRIHFGWTSGQQREAAVRPSTSSGLSPTSEGLDRAWGAPSDIYSHYSRDESSDSRPSTRGTWSFVTDTASKGGKKSNSNHHPSNRTKTSSDLDRGFPGKPRKVSRRGRKRSKLKSTKVVQPNAYDIWINNFK